MAPPRSAQITIGTKFPVETVERMDDLIREGMFSSRSVLIKEAVDRLLNQKRMETEVMLAIYEGIDRGAFNHLIDKRIEERLAIQPKRLIEPFGRHEE